MITDKLLNAHLYYSCHPKFKEAFEFLIGTDLSHIKPGRYDIDGDSVFALVQEIVTKPINQCQYESHEKYIDIQYIVINQETIGYGQIEQLTSVDDYHENGDARLYTGKGSLITLNAGDFAVFYPQDGHMPGISQNGQCGISKKVVLKIRCD